MEPGVTLFIHIIFQHLKFTQTCSDIMFKRLQEPTYDQAHIHSAALVIFSWWSYYFLIKMAMNIYELHLWQNHNLPMLYFVCKNQSFFMLVQARLFWTWSGGSLGGINGGHPAEARQVAGFHHLISPPTLLLETWWFNGDISYTYRIQLSLTMFHVNSMGFNGAPVVIQ